MSRSRPCVDASAPTFARDMMFVLNEVLGYDDAKIGELLVAGALEKLNVYLTSEQREWPDTN